MFIVSMYNDNHTRVCMRAHTHKHTHTTIKHTHTHTQQQKQHNTHTHLSCSLADSYRLCDDPKDKGTKNITSRLPDHRAHLVCHGTVAQKPE